MDNKEMDNRGIEKEDEKNTNKGDNKDQGVVAGGHVGEAGGSASVQPRMYECVFCKGSFTSAQALGGHMNVHRRERALLKQSLPLQLTAPIEQPMVSPYDQAVGSSSVSTHIYATRSREKQQELGDHEKSMEREKDVKKDEEELDLELRLGEKPGKK